MKTFVVAACLLVASAAGQSLGFQKLNKERLTSLSAPLVEFDRPLISSYDFYGRRLLGHPLERSLIYGLNTEIPSYLRNEILDDVVLGLDEVISHPLFRVYYNLPLFRQYWAYPMFQRYVASIYFQRFWTIPSFQQYFVNPVLFYKYIYPVVTQFKTDINSVYGGDYLIGNRNNLFPYSYNYNYGQQYDNVFVPSTYTNQIDDQVYYKYLLDRLYNHLTTQSQQQGRLQETLTEVELTPEGSVKEQTVGKLVDPVTGDVNLSFGDAKYVTEKIVPVTESTIEEEQTEKEINPFAARLFHGYRHPLFNRF